MAVAQQGKNIDEKLLDNYINRGRFEKNSSECRTKKHLFIIIELPIPSLDSLNDLEDRLLRIYRTDQGKSSLCYRYGDLCALDTILVYTAAEKKGSVNIFFK